MNWRVVAVIGIMISVLELGEIIVNIITDIYWRSWLIRNSVLVDSILVVSFIIIFSVTRYVSRIPNIITENDLPVIISDKPLSNQEAPKPIIEAILKASENNPPLTITVTAKKGKGMEETAVVPSKPRDFDPINPFNLKIPALKLESKNVTEV